jgi:hypothetical protein
VRSTSHGALLVLCLGAGAAGLGGCDAKTDRPVTTTTPQGTSTTPSGAVAEERGKALVRFVNALPGHPGVVLRSGEESPFQAVSYKSVTPYVEVAENVARFELVDPRGQVLATNAETLRDGERYTVVAMAGEEPDEITLRVLHDRLEAGEGKARLRVVNALSGVGDIDVHLDNRDDALFEDVTPGAEAGFQDLEPVGGRLAIRRDDGDRPVVTLARKQFQAGRAYTVVVTGREGQAEAITFDDVLSAGGLSAGAQVPDSN